MNRSTVVIGILGAAAVLVLLATHDWDWQLMIAGTLIVGAVVGILGLMAYLVPWWS